MSIQYRDVAPLGTLAGYIGGKRRLAPRVIAAIESEPHDLYAEPFIGMGGIFFRRRQAPKVEVINDISRDVATLFRVLQRHYEQFLDVLRWQVASRCDFERLICVDPDHLTDLERSARFVYVQRLAFGGRVVGRSFGIDSRNSAPFDVAKFRGLLEATHARLSGVWIECLPWPEFIRRWDRPGALFYCDPPYWGTEHYYGRGVFARADFAALAAALRNIHGRFVLTVSDTPDLRELFAWASIEPVELRYSVGRDRGEAAPARELLIRPPLV